MREAIRISVVCRMGMSRGIVRLIMRSRDIECRMKTGHSILTSTSLSTCSVDALMTMVATVVSSSCC